MGASQMINLNIQSQLLQQRLMHQRKKNQNKQNFKTIKKTTIQQINYTQQLHIPTFATMDLRQAGRSIQLKKSSSKKPASRKSRCISAKQAGVQTPLNLKQLLKQFKSMKIIQSRSKSPKQNKSKPKLKKSTKKILPVQPQPHLQTHPHLQLNSKSKSHNNLIQKLQQTINKLKQTSYFKDQDDSEIPLISTSQAFTESEKKKLEYIISGQNFQDINIRQLRLFCRNKQPGIRMNMDYFKGNVYELMARRIQRAWKRYRTHKLIQRYTNLQLNNPSQVVSNMSSINNEQNQEQIAIQSQQLYRQQGGQRKITYISNLESQSDEQREQKNEESDKLLHIKLEQLEKWSEIVTIINSNRSDNPQQTQKLLKKLMNKSQNNKRSLQIPKESSQPAEKLCIGRSGVENSQYLRYLENQNKDYQKQEEQDSDEQQEQQEQQQQQVDEDEQFNNAAKYQYQRGNKEKQLKQKQSRENQKQKERADPEIALQNLKKRLQQKQKQQKSSVSEDSIKQIQEQFNSKKYIQYLDSDMYPISNHHEQSLATIGLKKQQELLNKLKCQNSRKPIRGSKVLDSAKYNAEIDGQIKSRLSCRSGRSSSAMSSASSIDAQQLKSSRKSSSRTSKLMNAHIRKSISQKSIRYESESKNIQKLKNTKEQIQIQQNNQSQPFQKERQIKIKKPNSQQIRIQKSEEEQEEQIQKQKKQERNREIKKLELPGIPKISKQNSKNLEQDMRCIMRRQLQYQQIDLQLQSDQYQKFINSTKNKPIANKNGQNTNAIQEGSLQFQYQLELEQDRNLQKAYLQQQFYNKIKEYNKLKQEDSDADVEHNSNILEQSESNTLSNDLQVKTPPRQTKRIQSKNVSKQQVLKKNQRQDDSIDEGQEVQPILHRSQKQYKKVQIQSYDRDIQSQEGSSSQQIDKSLQISILLVNSLALQFLIQIGKYPQTILKAYKKIVLKKSAIKRAPKKSKKSGFPTNQSQVKGFIQGICSYVIDEQPHIFKNLQKATGPSALQMLRYMHQSVDSDIYIEEEEDDPTVMILPHWIFQNFWAKKTLTIKYQRQLLDQQREVQRQQFLKGLNKVFLRSCFDCLNQCLDYERNFGPFGKPFPWKKSHFFNHTKTYDQTKTSVKSAQKRMFDISATYCGIIVQKEQIATLGGNEQYITQIQQDRLSRMLAQDLVEGEQRWIFYDDEETELLVEASHIIFHQLIQEIGEQLVDLFNIFF